MNMTVIRIVVLLFIAGLVGFNCESPGENHDPTITALDLPDSVEVGTDATFSCTASDPDGDVLSYNWTSSRGTLLSTTTKTVGWTAPGTSGTSIITVVVQDSSGASDTSSGTVAVTPLVQTIIDWDGPVDAYSVQVWHKSIPAGYTVSGSFTANGQLITFLVLDSANYTRWGFPDSAYVGLFEADSSLGANFQATIPQLGIYHFVLDNLHGKSAVSAVHLTVQSSSP
jgi:hypothetical protein